jgi:hypothetical protein
MSGMTGATRTRHGDGDAAIDPREPGFGTGKPLRN